jgi:hypothetical protein
MLTANKNGSAPSVRKDDKRRVSEERQIFSQKQTRFKKTKFLSGVECSERWQTKTSEAKKAVFKKIPPAKKPKKTTENRRQRRDSSARKERKQNRARQRKTDIFTNISQRNKAEHCPGRER